MSRSNRAVSLTISGVLVVTAYIAAQMLSDVLSLKIAFVAGFSIDAGTFVYPFTFTLRDMVHKLLGRPAARAAIVAAGVVNLVMAGLFAFAAWLPPDPTWPLQREFAAVLAPVWRIVVASIVAEIASEFTDTEIYHLWVTRVTRRYQWARVLVSNSVSVPLDSLLFAWAGYSMLDTRCWVLGAGARSSSFQYLVSSIQLPVTSIQYPVSSIQRGGS
jgi:uncharacterized integral membrane protein (TIGR00697 family)